MRYPEHNEITLKMTQHIGFTVTGKNVGSTCLFLKQCNVKLMFGWTNNNQVRQRGKLAVGLFLIMSEFNGLFLSVVWDRTSLLLRIVV